MPFNLSETCWLWPGRGLIADIFIFHFRLFCLLALPLPALSHPPPPYSRYVEQFVFDIKIESSVNNMWICNLMAAIQNIRGSRNHNRPLTQTELLAENCINTHTQLVEGIWEWKWWRQRCSAHLTCTDRFHSLHALSLSLSLFFFCMRKSFPYIRSCAKILALFVHAPCCLENFISTLSFSHCRCFMTWKMIKWKQPSNGRKKASRTHSKCCSSNYYTRVRLRQSVIDAELGGNMECVFMSWITILKGNLINFPLASSHFCEIISLVRIHENSVWIYTIPFIQQEWGWDFSRIYFKCRMKGKKTAS